MEKLSRYCRHRLYHNNNQPTTILIFATKTPYETIFDFMNRAGVSKLSAIHEDQNLHEREMVIRKFRTGCITVVVTTDAAAAAVQDLDVMEINEVINLDMPDSIDMYVHRCAFARSTGTVISFIDEGDIDLIHGLIDCLNINRQNVPEWLNQMYLHNSKGKLKDYGTSTWKLEDDASAYGRRFSERSWSGICVPTDVRTNKCQDFWSVYPHTSADQAYDYHRQSGKGLNSADSKNYGSIFDAAEIPFSSSADGTNSSNSSDEQLEKIAKSSDSDINRSSYGDGIEGNDYHARKRDSNVDNDNIGGERGRQAGLLLFPYTTNSKSPRNKQLELTEESYKYNNTFGEEEVNNNEERSLFRELDLSFGDGTITDGLCEYFEVVGIGENYIAEDDHLGHNLDHYSINDERSVTSSFVEEDSFHDNEDYCYYSDYSM